MPILKKNLIFFKKILNLTPSPMLVLNESVNIQTILFYDCVEHVGKVVNVKNKHESICIFKMYPLGFLWNKFLKSANECKRNPQNQFWIPQKPKYPRITQTYQAKSRRCLSLYFILVGARYTFNYIKGMEKRTKVYQLIYRVTS